MSVQLQTSSLLPVPHGFTTRGGGTSEGPYRSLNLSLNVGDSPDRVAENIRRLASAAGVTPSELRSASQVHGARVVQSTELTGSCGEADAIWTSLSGCAVAVRVADCVPILIVDPIRRRVAAVHSGWRGTDLRIAAHAVQALSQQGGDPAHLLAAIGPSIGACCYAVSAELAARFSDAFGKEVVRIGGGGQHLDLALAVRLTLQQAGVRRDHIDVLPNCTSCDAERFFSHRRDQGITGRQMAFAVCRF